jgi:hypothetical protein
VQGDLKEFGLEFGLPPIGDFGIELRRAPGATGPLFDALAQHIETNFRNYQGAAA